MQVLPWMKAPFSGLPYLRSGSAAPSLRTTPDRTHHGPCGLTCQAGESVPVSSPRIAIHSAAVATSARSCRGFGFAHTTWSVSRPEVSKVQSASAMMRGGCPVQRRRAFQPVDHHVGMFDVVGRLTPTIRDWSGTSGIQRKTLKLVMLALIKEGQHGCTDVRRQGGRCNLVQETSRSMASGPQGEQVFIASRCCEPKSKPMRMTVPGTPLPVSRCSRSGS